MNTLNTGFTNAIEVSHLCKKYENFSLNDVSFKVEKGTVMGFIGQNGAGKSTTIKSILNVIKSDAGNISVFGLDNVRNETLIKDNIGVVYDDLCIPDEFSPRQIEKIMRNIYNEWDSHTYYDFLKRFSLPLKKKAGDFSRGMRMKLQIAIALSHNSILLIMDEPTSGLDPIVRSEILDIFMEYMQDENHTILLSSHILSDLDRIADSITFINNGKVLFSDSKLNIMENHGIIRCPKDKINLFDKTEIVGIRKNAFGADILVSNKEACINAYPDEIIENADLEEIMLFYVSGKNNASEPISSTGVPVADTSLTDVTADTSLTDVPVTDEFTSGGK